jgi:hypothetical protein
VTDDSWSARPAPYQPATPAGRFQPDMRASNADRDRTIDVIRAGFVEGRLDKQEFDERVDLAQRARTYADLLPLTRDLPVGPMPVTPHPMPAGPYPVERSTTNGSAIAAMICGLLAFPSLGITAIPAVILGNSARHEIRRSGQDGEGMATVGLLLGWGAIGLATLFIFAAMLVLAAHGASTPTGTGGP